MTTTVKEDHITLVAAEDLTGANKKYKAIAIAGTLTPSAIAAAGLLTTSVVSGGHASAVYAGITKAWAAAAVTSLGWPAALTTSGFLTNAASGDYTVGRFLDTCNSGDITEVFVDFKNLGVRIG